MKREEALAYCYNRLQKGETSIMLVEKLQSFGFSSEDAKFCVREADDMILAGLTIKKGKISKKENEHMLEHKTYGLSRLGIRNQVFAGIVLAVVSLVWFCVGYFYMNMIFFYPFILAGIGAIIMVKGFLKKN